MVSILRCASFRGIMLLGARNRYCGNLMDASDRFVELLTRIACMPSTGQMHWFPLPGAR